MADDGRSSTIFDRQALMDRIGGDEELFKELSVIFIEDAAKQIRCLGESLHQHSLEDLKYAAHTLKGAASNFGAVSMEMTARQLEHLLVSGDLSSADALLGLLASELEDLRKILQSG